MVVSLLPDEWSLNGETGKIHKILMGFSLRKNFKALTDTSLKEGIRGVDGTRALNVLSLLLSHKSMALFFNHYINRTTMAEVLTMPWAIIGRTAIIYTDSFLLISGFLTTTAFFRDLRCTGNIHFKQKLINRVFRYLQPSHFVNYNKCIVCLLALSQREFIFSNGLFFNVGSKS